MYQKQQKTDGAVSWTGFNMGLYMLWVTQGRFYLCSAAFLESENAPFQGQRYPGINSATAGLKNV